MVGGTNDVLHKRGAKLSCCAMQTQSLKAYRVSVLTARLNAVTRELIGTFVYEAGMPMSMKQEA